MKKENSKELQVVQKNEFIQKYQKQLRTLTFNDLLLFKTIVSKINSRDSLFKESYIVTYKDLNKAGFTDRNRYKQLNDCLKNLSNTMMVMEDEKGTRYTGIIKNDWYYPKRSEEVKIEIYSHMVDFLLDIKQQFTKYPLKILSVLQNKYDIILFEYFSSIKSMGSQKIGLDKLRDLLGLDDKKYHRTSILKSELLNKTLKRINDNTDIVVRYTDIKCKNKVVGFLFYIESSEIFSVSNYIKEILNTELIIDGNKICISDIREIQKDFNTLYLLYVENSLGLKGKIQNEFSFIELQKYISINRSSV